MMASDRNPLIPRREVDPRQELPELELEVLERWRERDVFAESLRLRADGAGRCADALLARVRNAAAANAARIVFAFTWFPPKNRAAIGRNADRGGTR